MNEIIQANYMTTHPMPSLVTKKDVALIWMDLMRCGADESDALRVTCETRRVQERKTEEGSTNSSKDQEVGRQCEVRLSVEVKRLNDKVLIPN